MPTYLYRCPVDGYREIRKPMAEASLVEECECGEYLERVFTPSAIVMRPDGYSLRPGDRGYWNFNRQQELHQLRDGEAGDQRRLDASLFERPAPPKLEIPYSQMREIRNLGEIVDREIRASSDIPEVVREGS